MSQAACDQVLRDGDHGRLRKGWFELFPHLRGPQTDEEAEIVLHHARTQTHRIEFKLRAWSHRWLTDHGIPSGLPDELRPRAERMYPVVISAVGVAVKTQNPFLKPVAKAVQHAMENAVLEADAEHRLEDAPFVRQRMQEARSRVYRDLLGVK